MSTDRELLVKSLAGNHVMFIYQCLSSYWSMGELKTKTNIKLHIDLSFGQTGMRGKDYHRHTQTSYLPRSKLTLLPLQQRRNIPVKDRSAKPFQHTAS
jgi:hypothetical protein